MKVRGEGDLKSLALLVLVPVSAVLCLRELSTFQLGKAVLVGPLLAVLLIGRRPGASWPVPPVLAAAVGMVLVGVVALLHSPSPGVGAWELWLDLLFLGALIGGARLGTSGPGQIIVAVAGAGAALVVVTALEAAGVGPLCPAAVSKAGTMGNPNFTGAVMALAAPASLALALEARRWWSAAAWSGLVLAILAAVVSLGSWTGAVGAMFGLFAAGIHALARRGRPRTAMVIALVLVSVVGGALSSSTVRGHLSDRWYMARVSAGAAAERPLAGRGLGGFPRGFLDAQAVILEDNVEERGRWTRALHAHSEPLHAFVERGVGGLLAWFALWGAIFWAFISARVQPPLRPSGTSPNKGGGSSGAQSTDTVVNDVATDARLSNVVPPPLLGEVSPQATEGGLTPCRDLLPGLTGILVAGFALSLGEFPGHLVPVQLALGLAVGGALKLSWTDAAPPVRNLCPLGATPRYRPVDGPPTGGVGPKGPPTGTGWWRHLIWLVAIPLFLVPPWLALSDRALTRGDPAEALRVNPWNGQAAFSVALAEQTGGAPTGCAHARLADRLLPSPASAMALGLCTARRGNLQEGIAALRRAARWNPRSAAAHANLAVLLLEAGDGEAARNHAIRASSLRPGDPQIQRVRDACLEPSGE